MSKGYIAILEYLAEVPSEIGPLMDEIEAVTAPTVPGTYAPFIESSYPPVLRVAKLADRFPTDSLKLAPHGSLERRRIEAEDKIKLFLAQNDGYKLRLQKATEIKDITPEERKKSLAAVSAPGGLWQRLQKVIEMASKIWAIYNQLSPIFAGGIPNLLSVKADSEASTLLRTGEADPPNVGRTGDGSEGYDKDGIAHRPENANPDTETARREHRDNPGGATTPEMLEDRPAGGPPTQSAKGAETEKAEGKSGTTHGPETKTGHGHGRKH